MAISAQPIDQEPDDADRICRDQDVHLAARRREVLELVVAAERPTTAYRLLDPLRELVGEQCCRRSTRR